MMSDDFDNNSEFAHALDPHLLQIPEVSYCVLYRKGHGHDFKYMYAFG